MEVPTPIDPETQTHGEDVERVSGQAYTLNVLATCPDERDNTKRLLGHVKIRPGLVAPGLIAAVRTPDGQILFRRIYYRRLDGGREFVCLESLAPDKPDLHYPLGNVFIEGVVVCVCGVDEECGCE